MVKKEFLKNVIPAMVAFAFTGVYSIVDGFFVGRSVGDLGLAAINVAYPLTSLIQATGTGLGMAGAVQIAICQGKKDKEEEKKYLGNTLICLVISSILLTLFLAIGYETILKLFGAGGTMLEYSGAYVKIIIMGTVFQVLSTGLVPIIRNYNGVVIAMLSMMGGFITNIALDWLFVYKLSYGVSGAALATILGQLVTLIPCIIFLIIKRYLTGYADYKLKKSTIKYILSIAVSPFGLTLTPNIVIIIINKGAIIYGGEAAVSMYAVTSYVICVIQLLLQGIGDGSQPLIGRYYGNGQFETVKEIRKMAYLFSAFVSGIFMVFMYFVRGHIAVIFGVSDEVAQMFTEVFPIFLSGLIFAAFLRITTAYFYAINKSRPASILIYGEPLLLLVFVTFVFPNIIGINGVWASVPITQLCLSITGAFLIRSKL